MAAGNAVSFLQPRLDDTQQRLLFKIASYLYAGLGFGSAAFGSGPPAGVTTPSFDGQLYQDTLSGSWYRSTGTTNSNWQLA